LFFFGDRCLSHFLVPPPPPKYYSGLWRFNADTHVETENCTIVVAVAG